jgi:integrase
MSSSNATGAGRRLVKTRYPGIYRRGNGYAVRFTGPDGKTHQKSARTEAEARRLRAELTADVQRGEYRPDTRVTFAAYAEQWISSYSGRTTRGIRSETVAEYRRDLRPAIERFGRLRLSEITPPVLRGYAQTMATEEELRSATIRRRMAPVRALLATAHEDGLIRSNPAAGLRLGGGSPMPVHDPDEEETAKALTLDELVRLVAAVPDDWRRTLVRLLAQSGLRISEALGLRWRDIDVSARRLHVRQRVRSGRAGAPKSDRGRREVPCSASLARELAALQLASLWSADDDLVFAGELGGARWARGLYRWFKPAAQRAGVPWAGFHALRHTAASRWLAAGVSLAVVARLLGHADAAFTLRVYVHALPSDLPEGDALAAAVGLP